MSEIKKKYRDMDPECRRQCRLLIQVFKSDKTFNKVIEENIKREKDEELPIEKLRKYQACNMIKDIPLLKLLKNNRIVPLLKGYNTGSHNDKHKDFILKSKVAHGDHVCVYSGELTVINSLNQEKKLPIICKYYESGNKKITFELECYSKLREMGMNIPWFTTSYKLLGEPVLIMEKLDPINLSKGDNPYKMGQEVLQQLKYINRLGVHNDLKPGNIMVRRGNHEVFTTKDSFKYVVIDYGGMALDKLEYGYKKHTRTPKFTSQKKTGKTQITTGLNDMIELGYVMNFLINQEETSSSDGIVTVNDVEPTPFDYRKDFSGRLKKYMKILKSVDPAEFDPIKDAELYDILSKTLQ